MSDPNNLDLDKPKKNKRGCPYGQVHNPGGRPKKKDSDREAEMLFKQHSPAAARVIFALMDGPDKNLALKAAIYVTDRALGKAKEHVEVAGDLQFNVIIGTKKET